MQRPGVRPGGSAWVSKPCEARRPRYCCVTAGRASFPGQPARPRPGKAADTCILPAGARVFPQHCLKELLGVNMEKASRGQAGRLTPGVRPGWGTWPALPLAPLLWAAILGCPGPWAFVRLACRRAVAEGQCHFGGCGDPHCPQQCGGPRRRSGSPAAPAPHRGAATVGSRLG